MCTACCTAIITEFLPHGTCVHYIHLFAEMFIILVDVSSLLTQLRCRNRILEHNVDKFRI